MSYFNIDIDNDITYLLQEIGKNCKVENIPASAIVNNSSLERTFDDKKIITTAELKRGNYVEYNNLYFLILNEINDKRYNTYFKAIMRVCNYDVKFVIAGKLYLFYSIVESDKFNINESQLINTLADTITITVPATKITSKIKVGDRIIKFGKAWEIQGVDYTKKGLINLHCKVTAYNEIKDDLEREIADIDKLDNPNSTAIYPFSSPDPEPISKNIISVESLADISVENGTLINDIVLPSTVMVTLDDATTQIFNVIWDTSSYNESVAGTYNLNGNIELIEGVTNTNNIKANINIIVAEPQTGDNFTIEIAGDDTINMLQNGNYTAVVKNNGAIVLKDVTFSVNNSLANILSQGNNKCELVANKDFNIGEVNLRATLLEDETIFTEILIYVTRM